MKKIIPWVCLMAAAQSSAADVNHDGLDAYREGHYLQATATLERDSVQDPVALFYLGRMRLYGYGALKNNSQALRYFKSAAERGSLPAMLTMGRIALNADNNPTEALKWYKKAADANNLYAQLYCAAAYKVGFGTSKNTDLLERYIIGAAKNGNLLAQYTLAQSFMQSKHDSTKRAGIAWLEKAANKQYPPAMYLLGQLYATGNGVKKDDARSKLLMDAAQQKGYAPTQPIENQASNTPENQAARWLTDNKETSLAASGYGLRGILSNWQNKNSLEENRYNQPPQMEVTTKNTIYNPQFVMVMPNDVPLLDYYDAYIRTLSKSSKVAWDFLRYSLVMPAVTERLIEKAILGDSTAQFALGQLYQQGVGVEKDMAQAIKYYNNSAAQHDLRAEYNLGLIYLDGENGKPDYQQAMGWLTDAAFKGSADAQYVLGQIATRGYHDASGTEVIPADTEQAKSMYYLGAANHHGPAQYKLAELISREPTRTLSVEEKQKRFKLLESLYQGARDAGVHEAGISLAFFQAMSDDKAQQALAFQVASKAADEGDQAGDLLLGLLYDRGIGIEPSRSKAIKYYEKVAGNPVTSFILGTYALTDDKDIEKGKQLLLEADNAEFSYAPLNFAMLEKQQNQDFMPSLLKARTLGNHAASLLLADYYLTEYHEESQLNEARVIYQQVAEKGDPNGQLKLGYMFEQGLGGPVDLLEASKWYEQAAQGGQPIAQYRLGRLNQLGRLANKPDYATAKKWYATAMGSYSPAAVALGFIYDTVDDNYKQAMIDYQAAADRGDTIGQFDLGLIYEKGKGLPVDYEKAQKLYLSAANKGHVQSMVQLADLYLAGAFGARDEKSALEWYQKAAEKGDRDALYQLGLLAETGVGLTLNYADAIKYYQASGAKGNAQAMLALARMYQYGQGVAKNNQEAEILYKDLSKMGNAYASYQLATMTYEGALGEQNKAQARQWLETAANQGSQQAQQVLLWLSAQTDTRVSFIEPVVLNAPTVTRDEPAHWRYWGAVNAWNQGNEGNSRRMLNQLLQEYPNYTLAKEAYQNIQSADVWDLSTANSG